MLLQPPLALVYTLKQQLDGCFYFICGQTRIVDYKRVSVGTFPVAEAAAQAGQLYALFPALFHKAFVRKGSVYFHKKVKSCILLLYPYRAKEGMHCDFLHEHITLRAVVVAHAVYVLFIVALLYKLRQSILLKI